MSAAQPPLLPTTSAVLVRSGPQAEVSLSFEFGDCHPVTGISLRVWVKQLPGWRWDPAARVWTVAVAGLAPGTLAAAGFTVVHPDGSRARRSDLERTEPVGATPSQPNVAVPDWFALPLDPYQVEGAIAVAVSGRLLCDAPGVGKTRQALAAAAILGSERTLILCPPGVVTHWTREATAAQMVETTSGWVAANLSPQTSRRATHPDVASTVPVATSESNHSRPPNQLGLADQVPITVFRAGRKPPPLPTSGIVIVPDSDSFNLPDAVRAGDLRPLPAAHGRRAMAQTVRLVTARHDLADSLAGWEPTVLIYDEAHRAKTWESQRSTTARRLATAAERTILVTGTPMFANPTELIPLMDMSGHLEAVFGGRDRFTVRYLKLRKFKGRPDELVPIRARLPELSQILDNRVWIRRTKEQVKLQLPPKRRLAAFVDVDRTAFDAAYREVVAKVDAWLEGFRRIHGIYPPEEPIYDPADPDGEEGPISGWCHENIGMVSMLRKAAGLARVPAATELITQWVAANTGIDDSAGRATCTTPLVVWTHHQEVTEAMAAAVPPAVNGIGGGARPRVGIIAGGTSQVERDALVDAFQAGQLPVLVCSIAAAGVGITLTRASDALFVETDWTPAVFVQAEDRLHRRGQQNHVTFTTMIAVGTLDEQVQAVLNRKGEILDAVMPGGDHHPAVTSTTSSPADAASILTTIVYERLAKKRAKSKSRSKAA